MPLPARKLTPEIVARIVELAAGEMTHNRIREVILDEFGVAISRPSVIGALNKYRETKATEEAVRKAEVHEAQLNAEAARAVAATVAAADLPADAKLLQLRLASLVARSNGAWEGMSPREKSSFRVWSKLEDLVLRTLVLKLKLGGALKDDSLDGVDEALNTKLDQLAAKLKAGKPT